MANKSQTTAGLRDVSVTVAATWTRVCAEDQGGTRSVLLMMNTGTHNMGIYFAPIGNNNTTPTPVGIGTAGVYTMVPNGSYEPDGGFIPQNEVWVIGTASDVLTASISP